MEQLLKEMNIKELLQAFHEEAKRQGMAKTFKEGIEHAISCGIIRDEILKRTGK